MDVREKLNLLGAAARFDDCRAAAPDVIAEGRGFFAPETSTAADPLVLPCISHLHTPNGQRKTTLKILQTSACQNNCNYCAFRAGRDIRRADLTPDDLARSFDLMYRAGLVESLFLSSGVVGTHRTMDEMLATVELVRQRYGFRGYVHLKLLPGAEDAHIERAVELADRVSVNLEAPTPAALAALAPLKRMDALVGPLRKAAQMICRGDPLRSPAPTGAGIRAGARPAPTMGHARIGMSTQFVVGPAGESDRESAVHRADALPGTPAGAGILQRVHAGARHAAGGRAAHRSAARVSPVPGRLAAALLPFLCRRAAVRFRWPASHRRGPQSRVGWRGIPSVSRWRSTPPRWTSCCGCPAWDRLRPGRSSRRGGGASCARSATCASWVRVPTGPRLL